MRLSVIDRAKLAIAALVDGLCDPKRCRHFTFIFVCAYAAAWLLYGLIAKSSQDVNADMAEMVVWSREPALGYPKHPPLLAYVIRAWFAIFPLSDWAFTLLAVATVSAGIYLAVELCGLWLQGEKRAAAPFLLAVIPFYNVLGLKFDQNSALIPVWALTMWAFVRALETRRSGWAVLMGVGAAAAMLIKYWSAFLLVALALTALFDRRRIDYFRSSAPWITIAVFLLAMLPHGVWLVNEHFPPAQYVVDRRATHSLADYLQSFVEYSAGTFGYAAIALGLALVVFRPSMKAVRDSWFALDPERRPATLLFWTPLLLPIVVSSITETNLLSVWNEPALNLLPVMMLASPLVLVSRHALRRLAGIVIAITALMLAVSPLVALRKLQTGVENDALYARLVAEAAEREWRATTSAPLRLVAGPATLASAAAFYMADRPSTFADFSDFLSPWATPARIAREGLVIVCPAGDDVCLGHLAEQIAERPPGRRAETTLTPTWLGLVGRPERFVIVTAPPQP